MMRGPRVGRVMSSRRVEGLGLAGVEQDLFGRGGSVLRGEGPGITVPGPRGSTCAPALTLFQIDQHWMTWCLFWSVPVHKQHNVYQLLWHELASGPRTLICITKHRQFLIVA